MAKVVDEKQSPFARAAAEGPVGQSDGTPPPLPRVVRHRSGPPPQGTVDWQEAFLEALRQGASVTDATAMSGITIKYPYERRRRDAAFRRAWNEATEIGTRMLVQEAQRRAFHGVEEPVFYKGVQCGVVRKYSDPLLMFLIKKRDPSYRESAVAGGTNVTINLFERVEVLTEQLRTAGVVVDAGVPAGHLLGVDRREPLDQAHADVEADRVPTAGR